MTEEQTFDKLRRMPLHEMKKLIDGIERPNLGSINLGNGSINLNQYYDKSTYILEVIKVLNKHGWDVEDYHRALEKDAIIRIVDDYNASLNFPEEIINRAKTFFPNIKFTKASIELE